MLLNFFDQVMVTLVSAFIIYLVSKIANYCKNKTYNFRFKIALIFFFILGNIGIIYNIKNISNLDFGIIFIVHCVSFIILMFMIIYIVVWFVLLSSIFEFTNNKSDENSD